MTHVLPILAKSDEDSLIKLVFGVIVMIFWIGGALISAIKKRADEAKRRARTGRMAPTFTRPIAQPTSNAGFPTAQRAPKIKANKRAVKRQPVPPPRVTIAPALSRAVVAQPAPAVAKPPARAPAPPAQIAQLLRRPESLRAALILNEVLSPPLSLRDGSMDGRSV
jgi:hypothetical protein